MAIVATNLLVNGLSGKFGNTLMFKTLRGKTFVSAMARKPDKKKESNAQRNTRSTFREATQWAQHILYDPEKKAYYQQRARALKLPNAYTAAITDYMRKVKVKKLVEEKGIMYAVSKPGFLVQDVRITTDNPVLPVSILKKKDTWYVRIAWPENEVPHVTMLITDLKKREQQFDDVPV